MTLDDILQILEEKFPSILDTVQLVLIYLMNRRVGKVVKVQTNAATVSTVPDTVPAAESKVIPATVSPKTVKKELRDKFLADLDLFFSSKDSSELNEKESESVARILTFINGGQ